MYSSKNIKNDLKLVNTYSNMITAYQQIYVHKMNKFRDKVINNRSYSDGLSQVYKHIKISYYRKLKAESRQQLQIKYNRQVVVLLTAKKRLSGEINYRIFSKFHEFIKKHPNYDIVIVGSFGKSLFEKQSITKPFKYFDLDEDNLEISHLTPLMSYIINYRSATMFYGKFSSLIKQEVAVSNVRGDLKIGKNDKEARVYHFLFEPSVEEILNFFEDQIFSSLFLQTANESNLAQMGSKIRSMQDKVGKIEDRKNELKLLNRKMIKLKRYKKQLQTLAGMSLWK